jgi:hypothetical protein
MILRASCTRAPSDPMIRFAQHLKRPNPVSAGRRPRFCHRSRQLHSAVTPCHDFTMSIGQGAFSTRAATLWPKCNSSPDHAFVPRTNESMMPNVGQSRRGRQPSKGGPVGHNTIWQPGTAYELFHSFERAQNPLRTSRKSMSVQHLIKVRNKCSGVVRVRWINSSRIPANRQILRGLERGRNSLKCYSRREQGASGRGNR